MICPTSRCEFLKLIRSPKYSLRAYELGEPRPNFVFILRFRNHLELLRLQIWQHQYGSRGVGQFFVLSMTST